MTEPPLLSHDRRAVDALTAHRLDAMETAIVDLRAEVREGMHRINERLEPVTRLQEADVRLGENLERALGELVEMRRDSRAEAQVQQTRWEHVAKATDERWRAHETFHSDARAQIDDNVHRIDTKLSWFAGVLCALQIAASVVAYFYIRTVDAMEQQITAEHAVDAQAATDRHQIDARLSRVETWLLEVLPAHTPAHPTKVPE